MYSFNFVAYMYYIEETVKFLHSWDTNSMYFVLGLNDWTNQKIISLNLECPRKCHFEGEKKRNLMPTKLNDSTVMWRFFRLFSAVRFTRSNSRLTDLVTIVGNKWHLGALVKLFEEHIGQEWFEPWDNLNWLVNNL